MTSMQWRGIIRGLVCALAVICLPCTYQVLAQPRHAPLTMPRQRIVQSCGSALVTTHSTSPYSLSTIVGLSSIGRLQSSSSRMMLGLWVPISVITDVDSKGDVVSGARVWSWPNPFRENVSIELMVPFIESAHADIYNNHGSHVSMIRASAINTDGATLSWNGLDANGDPVANGVYTVRLIIRQFTKHASTILSATILCNR